MAKNYYHQATFYGDFKQIESQMPAMAFNNPTAARNVAEPKPSYAILTLEPSPDMKNASTVYWAAEESVIRRALGHESGGGTGGSKGGRTGAGGGQAGQAGAAVQAGVAKYTGGGPLVKAQPVNNSMILQTRDDSFEGIDTFTPQEKLGAGLSPDSNNWDGFNKIGSRCVRKGTAKLEDDHDSLSVNAALFGLSLSLIPNDTPNQLQMMYSFADAAIGATRAAVATELKVVLTSPQWGHTATLKGWQGPTLAVIDAGLQVAQVTYSYPNNVGVTGKLGVRANSVEQIIIRWSIIDYPRDVDGFDLVNSTAIAAVDRTEWHGLSAAESVPSQTTGDTIYIAAWAVSREGYSERSTASITVA